MIDYENSDIFVDPLLRCEDCTKLVHINFIVKQGGCSHCGNRRFKNVQGFKGDEWKLIKKGKFDFGLKKKEWYPIDPDFLKLFERADKKSKSLFRMIMKMFFRGEVQDA